MNDRIGELEKHFHEFEDETNHNLTMLIGQSWKQGEQLRLLKSTMVERFDRLDSRVTEAHKEIAEQTLQIEALTKDVAELKTAQYRMESTQAEQGAKLDQILALLQQK